MVSVPVLSGISFLVIHIGVKKNFVKNKKCFPKFFDFFGKKDYSSFVSLYLLKYFCNSVMIL